MTDGWDHIQPKSKLRQAAQQALEALENHTHEAQRIGRIAVAINALRAALDDTQDWNEVEALQASLREHMAEIQRLRAAGRQALGALQFCLPLIEDYGDEQQLAIHHKALAELTEYAMQRLTDVQQEIKDGANTVQPTDSIYSRVSDSGDRNVEAVTDCRNKVGDNLSPPLDRFADDGKTSNHIADASKMVEPVGYGVFEDGNLHDSFRLEHEAKLFAAFKGDHAEVWPLYTAPPKREPLTAPQIHELDWPNDVAFEEILEFTRAVERAHGIGGEE